MDHFGSFVHFLQGFSTPVFSIRITVLIFVCLIYLTTFCAFHITKHRIHSHLGRIFLNVGYVSIATASVRAQDSRYGICGEQGGSGTCFYPTTSVFPCQHHHTNTLCLILFSKLFLSGFGGLGVACCL